jgi:hypothetical protein
MEDVAASLEKAAVSVRSVTEALTTHDAVRVLREINGNGAKATSDLGTELAEIKKEIKSLGGVIESTLPKVIEKINCAQLKSHRVTQAASHASWVQDFAKRCGTEMQYAKDAEKQLLIEVATLYGWQKSSKHVHEHYKPLEDAKDALQTLKIVTVACGISYGKASYNTFVK